MFLFGSRRLLKKHCSNLTPRLYRLAWSWCHDTNTAQDRVQETWARAFERADQLKDETRLLAWLSRIMVNIYHDRQRQIRDHLELDQVELSSGDTTLVELTRKDEIQLIREAVARLPEDQRMVLTLVDLMELSYAQTADALDIPVGTVMSRLSRSRRRLRELVQPRESEAGRSGLWRVK